MTIQPEARQPLWQRYPAAQQRLRAALLAATFPRLLDVDAWIEANEAGWSVSVALPALALAFSESFTASELRAFRGRWESWCSEIAAQASEQAQPSAPDDVGAGRLKPSSWGNAE